MNANTFHPEGPAPLQGETAVVHEVTAAMMDEAAREAARLADGVAHHTIRHDDRPAVPARDPVPAGDEAAAPVPAGDEAAAPVVPSRAEAGDGTAEAPAAAPRAGAAEGFEAATAAGGPVAAATVQAGMAGAVAAVETAARSVGDTAAAVGGELGAQAPGLFRSAASLQRYNARVLDIVQDNVAATGAFLAALMGARTLPEAVQVNVDHATRGLQALTSQSRDLANLAQQLALDVLKPFDGVRKRDE